MIILRNKKFSKMQDEDYIEEQVDRKKAVKHAKGVAATALGAGGGILGGHVGLMAKGGKGALVGAGVGAATGAYLGYKAGKKHKESVEKDADRKIDKYNKASEKDKKYLREKEAQDKDLKLKERQARAQERMAWNSYRY